MAFSLNELLNPAPSSGAASPIPPKQMNSANDASPAFAPELFHPSDAADASDSNDANDASTSQNALAAMAQQAASAMASAQDPDTDMADADRVKEEAVDNGNYPPLAPAIDTATDSAVELVDNASMPAVSSLSPSATRSPDGGKDDSKQRKKGPGKAGFLDPDNPKSSVHSSKNEGVHTDRRYLCYLCNKLFTRRRSVRDHISKIHNTKTWEPLRSLEIVVDPATGEPTEPLEDIVARGPPAPPPKPPKEAKEKAARAPKRDGDPKDDGDCQLEALGPCISDHSEDGHAEGTYPLDTTKLKDSTGSPAPLPTTHSAASPPPSSSGVAALKKEPTAPTSRASSLDPFAVPAPIIGKKRPAPSDSPKPTTTAATKKGTAKPKATSAPNKRSKLGEATSSPPPPRSALRSPSAAPSNHLKTQPSKLKKQTSAASAASSPSRASSRASSRAASVDAPSLAHSATGSPGSSNDDGDIFCICRKGDNHTWMIACDGGCDEWFHGNCVNIRERDGDLIDKYICPTCTKPGLITTWKRMCRRKDCRKPARVMQDPPSKYCSDACGRMFMADLVSRGDSSAQMSKDGQYILEPERSKKVRKRAKRLEGRPKPSKLVVPLVNGEMGELINAESRLATPAYSDDEKTEYDTDSSLDDEQLPNRGAALRAGEIKALVLQCQTIDKWRRLGRKPDTPPRETDAEDSKHLPLIHDDLEVAKLADLEEQKRQLNARHDILAAREAQLELIKKRSTSITDELKKSNPKAKDLCGFDPRLAWNDEQFAAWYENGGKAVIADTNPKIGPPDDADDNITNGVVYSVEPDNGNEDDEEAEKMPKKGGVCVKNRCPRHRSWAKTQLAEIRFEQDLVKRRLARCDAQVSEMRERGVLRAWEGRVH